MMRRFNWRSGSNSSKESTSAKGDRKVRDLAGRKSTRARNSNALRLEVLERREMMAADILHNALIPQDVNSDFRVTSLDALGIVNYLNAAKRGALPEGEAAATAKASGAALKLDVNNDSRVSSLDLLAVINRINSKPEGEDILAQVNQIAIGADGNELPFTMVNNVKQYNIGVGQQFTIRTQILDNRNSVPGATASGVFGSYLDIDYKNVNNSPAEQVQALYGESLSIDITPTTTGGTFRLSFPTPGGAQETADIVVATFANNSVDRATTSNNIRNAIGALPFVGGVNNVSMLPPLVKDNGNFNFAFNFVNSLYRTDVPNATVTSPVLSGSGASVVATSSFDPAIYNVISSAITYPINQLDASTAIKYSDGPSGGLNQISPGHFELNEIGGTQGGGKEYFDGRYVNVDDVLFRGSVAGTVEFTTNIAESEGISLLGDTSFLLAANIQFSAPIRINVVDRIKANDDTFTVTEDSTNNQLNGLTSNDTVIVGTLVGITAVTQPVNNTGTVTFTPNGQNVVFTPAPNFFGQTTFTYTVANNQGDTSVGTVTVTVNGVNDPPIAITPPPTSPSIAEDSSVPLTVGANVFFLAGPGGETGPLKFKSASLVDANAGSVTINANGELVFTPAANFFGTVPVVVTATDTDLAVSQAVTIQLNVTPINDAPIAKGPTFSTNEDTTLNLTGTQLFAPGPSNESTQTITLANVALAPGQSGATLSINGSGQLVVVPTANFNGSVIFSVDGTDNGSPALTTRGTFTITVAPVNDPPTATADNFVVVSSTGQATQLDVLANDSAGPANEPNSDLRITRIFNHTGSGTVTIAADGLHILYTPAVGQVTGSDSFSYEITDSSNAAIALKAQAAVTIDIVPPVLPYAVQDNRSIAEGTASTTIDVLANDLINDGAKRSLDSFTQPASGTVTRNDNGTPADTSDDKLVFVPSSADFFGQVSFNYVLKDDKAGSDPSTGTVNITVTEVNDAPTVVTDQNATAPEDSVNFQITAATLLAGSNPGPLESSQTISLQSARVLSGGGSVALVNGNLSYTAAANFVGNAVVEFTAVDNGTTNGVADPKTAVGRVTIAITPVNDAPVAANDTATTAEDTAVDIPFTSVLANDRPGPANATDELQNQQLTVTAVSVVSGGGTASIVGSNIRYVPAANSNGQVVLQYTIRDSEISATPGFTALTANAQITITVTEVNDTPANFTATRSVFAGLPTNVNLTAELAATSRGAVNEASQTLKISRIIPGSVQGGTATLNADGTVTFTAPTGSSGTGSFQVETIDNGTTNGVSDPKTGLGTVTINIAPFQPSTVSGHVWFDDDSDGSIDSDEHMIGGVEVTLKGTTVAEGNNSYSNTIVTGADGAFNFDVLPPGSYTLSYKTPNGVIDGASPNELSYKVDIPGGKNVVTNFNVKGVNVAYSSVLDNLAQGYYNSHPAALGKGVDAVVNADGSLAFSSVHGGYSNIRFAEVTLTSDKLGVVLTLVGNDMSVRTAVVPRGKYFITRDDAGVTYVKIVALESELTFVNSNSAPAAAAQSSNYLDSVDEYFANFS